MLRSAVATRPGGRRRGRKGPRLIVREAKSSLADCEIAYERVSVYMWSLGCRGKGMDEWMSGQMDV